MTDETASAADTPTRAELPTSAQLLKSTILALIAAAFILVAVVLPAEYASGIEWAIEKL